MNHRRMFTAGVIAPLLAVLAFTGCSKDPKEHRVAVLFTTDEHSHVFAIAPELDDWPPATAAGTGALVGGVARRARLIDEQRAAMSDTVLLSSGDATQGSLAGVPFTQANYDMQLMKAMGYDAVSIGNHEFDWTSTGLAMAVGAGRASTTGIPQLVLTNVKFGPAGGPDAALAALYGAGKPIAPSHVITTPGGLKVGVVASMGLSAAEDAGPFAAPVTFTNGLPTSSPNALAAIASQLQPAIDALRADAKVDVVVLLSHGGVGEGQVGNEDEALAARLTGVDLVLGGHSHAPPQPTRFVNDPSGHKVAVLQTSAYGKDLGRAELVWLDGDRPRLDTDPARTRYIPIDDRTRPTTSAVVGGLVQTVVGSLEQGSTPSFLEQTLFAVTGSPVAHTNTLGALYFYPLGKITFAVDGQKTGESNMLNLDTDAMLAAAQAFGPTTVVGPTQVALQARGSMRASFAPGKTGVLSFADVFRVASLGLDPTNPSPGYPILSFLLARAELRAAIEGTLLKSLQNPDFYVSPAGLKVIYDRGRPMWNPANPTGPGWVTYMATVSGGVETPFYDVTDTASGWIPGPAGAAVPVAVAATYQLGAFASTLRIVPRDPATGAPQPDLSKLIVRYPAVAPAVGPAVKDHQALARYVKQVCDANPAPNAGFLPSRYDATTAAGHIPRRMVCVGIDCPP